MLHGLDPDLSAAAPLEITTPAGPPAERLDENAAFTAIKATLRGCGATVYHLALRARVIEVSFLTPAVHRLRQLAAWAVSDIVLTEGGAAGMAEVAAAQDPVERYEATVTTKGQVTLPQRMRLDVDIREGDRLVFTKLDDGRWVLSRIMREPPDIDALRGQFRTPGDARTTDEIMEEIRGRRPGDPLP